MISDRYEQYVFSDEGIPFVLFGDLLRPGTVTYKEANWHDNAELQICEGGSGYVILDGRRIPFEEGDIVMVEPNSIHFTGSESSVIYSCMIFDKEFCRRADIDLSHMHFEDRFRDKEIFDIIRYIKDVFGNRSEKNRTAKLQMLTLSLLIALEKHQIQWKSESKCDIVTNQNVKNAIRFIRENYHEKIGLEAIAKSIFVNKFALARQFKAATRQTVTKYLNSYRCAKAKELIEGGTSVSDAAHLCGFGNMSFFSKTFKSHTGILPIQCKPKFDNSHADLQNRLQ